MNKEKKDENEIDIQQEYYNFLKHFGYYILTIAFMIALGLYLHKGGLI